MSEPAVGSIPVSVVIAAKNEGEEIAQCIASVRWASEILVVENDSTDDTVERARSAGATVFSHPFTTIGAQRNAAITRATHQWILVVDADERGTPALGSAIVRVIEGTGDRMAWRLTRRNFFLGREIRHGGWERDRPVRLFPRTLKYDERPVHEHVITNGVAIEVLGEALLHTPYASMGEYLEKLTRYSGSWAAQAYDQGRRASPWAAAIKAPARFATMYLVRSGWRDGTHGAILAVLSAVSVATKYAWLWSLSRRRDS